MAGNKNAKKKVRLMNVKLIFSQNDIEEHGEQVKRIIIVIIIIIVTVGHP